MAASHRTVRKNTIQIANEFSEEQYAYRPAPDTRTVGELLAHIAAITIMAQRLHGDDRQPQMSREQFGAILQEIAAKEKTLTTKADIIKELETEGEAFANWIEGWDEARFSEVVTFGAPGNTGSKTRFEMMLGTKEHEMHHRGQLMLIQRMLGIVPHLTRARAAAFAR